MTKNLIQTIQTIDMIDKTCLAVNFYVPYRRMQAINSDSHTYSYLNFRKLQLELEGGLMGLDTLNYRGINNE